MLKINHAQTHRADIWGKHVDFSNHVWWKISHLCPSQLDLNLVGLLDLWNTHKSWDFLNPSRGSSILTVLLKEGEREKRERERERERVERLFFKQSSGTGETMNTGELVNWENAMN